MSTELRRLEQCPESFIPGSRTNTCGATNPKEKAETCCLVDCHDSDHALISLSGLIFSTWPSTATAVGMLPEELSAYDKLMDTFTRIECAIEDAEYEVRQLRHAAQKSNNDRLLTVLEDCEIVGSADEICSFPFGGEEEFEELLISYE